MMNPSGRAVPAAVIAQRVCDILLSFPAAAAGGVQWRTLVRKYEERHSTSLDLLALGHTSALPAATALLWEVLRLVDAQDVENPIVAIEDAVALTPRPGFLGSWPSLYSTLCTLVENNGTSVPASDGAVSERPVRGILLSKLKPLLQHHWHTNFDESGMGFLSDEGLFVRLKKMKHLVQAVIRWRDQRTAWRQAKGARPSEIDEVLGDRQLTLTPSQKHNDLMLSFFLGCERANESAFANAQSKQASRSSSGAISGVGCAGGARREHADCATVGGNTLETTRLEMERELAILQAENAQLRQSNSQLLSQDEVTRKQTGETPEGTVIRVQETAEIFDDPFDPPPEVRRHEELHSMHPCGQWLPHDVSFGSSSTATPLSMVSSSIGVEQSSGAHTPMTPMTPRPGCGWGDVEGSCANGEASRPFCALVPMWFSFVPSAAALIGDRSSIPTGIVQRFRTHFEHPSAGAVDAGGR